MYNLNLSRDVLRILSMDTNYCTILCNMHDNTDYIMSDAPQDDFVAPIDVNDPASGYADCVYEANLSTLTVPIKRGRSKEDDDNDDVPIKKRQVAKRITTDMFTPFMLRSGGEYRMPFISFTSAFPDYTDGSRGQRQETQKFLWDVYRLLEPYVIDEEVLHVVDSSLRYISTTSKTLANSMVSQPPFRRVNKTFKRRRKFVLSASTKIK